MRRSASLMRWADGVCCLLAGTALSMSAAPEGVKVWQGTLPLPTYEEGPPDVNPPFDLFSPYKVNYPYTIRDNLTGLRQNVNWRAVFLENEYLQCSALPDLGGHVYTCIDKINGKPMFYANPSIKKAIIGYRGAWAAFGIEFNFPVSHNWVSLSPVDFGYLKHPDGSASVTIGNTDRVYGMRWNVELILRPGSTVLEQKVTLENISDVRRRFYWWNNAGVEAWEDSKIEYPMQFTEGHGLADIDSWPVDSHGVDLSVMANQKFGPVSRFVHGSGEPFMGIYHPHTGAGVVHYADYSQLPAKKIWSWGEDPEGLSWRTTLSDNNSAYVEVQAGLFRNQETYSFLEPGQTIQFEEYWMPVRGIGGITRANLQGVLAIKRETQPDGRISLRTALNVNRRMEQAVIHILEGPNQLFAETVDLDPRRTWVHEVKDLPADRKYALELLSSGGSRLLRHTEGVYDWTPRDQVKIGPVVKPPVPPEDQWKLEDFLKYGAEQELNGNLAPAWQIYSRAAQRFAVNPELAKARGRLAIALLRYEDAERELSSTLAAMPADGEAQYYMGLAEEALGRDDKGRAHFELAQRDPKFSAAANLQLAELAARERGYAKAYEYLAKAKAASPDDERVWEESVAVLRECDREAESKKLAQDGLGSFPDNSFVRYEMTLAGEKDEDLWMHLGADPDRVLNLALTYVRLGMFADAESVLRRRYPEVPLEQAEPGQPRPQDDPRVMYLFAYCVAQRGLEDPRPVLDAASKMGVLYIFANRAEMLPVLRLAIERNPSDANAHFLLGSLLFSRGNVEQAVSEWQQARKLNPKLTTLHYDLGRALFEVLHKPGEAGLIYEEGLTDDPGNAGLYLGLNELMKAQGKPAADRAAMMKRYPLDANMPETLVRTLIATLREAGKNEEADAWVRTHFFARAEGGPPAPKVSSAATPEPKPEKYGFAARDDTASGAAIIRSLRAKADAVPITDPSNPFWKNVPGVSTAGNQYGSIVAARNTEFRSRWTDEYLYFLFICPFETLYLKPDPKTNEDTVGLWDFDVAEVFLGSDFGHIKQYKEFEVSPQGEWVDLDINLDAPHKEDGWRWNSGFQVAARIDREAKIWYGAMKIPYPAVDSRVPRTGLTLRANLYRIEGTGPGRKFICWQPTHSPTFHMPVAFGRLELVE